jgi:hypothetical protein
VEHSVHEVPIDLALMRTVRIPQQRQRAILCDNTLPALFNFVERLVPGNGCELAGALRACPTQRGLDPLRRMHDFGVAIDLRACESIGVWLLRIAGNLDHAAIIDGRNERAHARAIVRTSDTDFLHSSTPMTVALHRRATKKRVLDIDGGC